MSSAGSVSEPGAGAKPQAKRSDEAIRRRAEKRGRTFEEQLQHDVKKTKGKEGGGGGGEVADPAPKKARRGKDEPRETQQPQSEDKWVCDKCKNENFASRSACHRCQNPRHSSAAASPNNKKQPSKKQKPGVSSAGKHQQKSSWSIQQPSAEEMEENSLLRSLGMLAEENPDLKEWQELSEDERSRARILVERSRRKAHKRSKLKEIRVKQQAALKTGPTFAKSKGKAKGEGKSKSKAKGKAKGEGESEAKGEGKNKEDQMEKAEGEEKKVKKEKKEKKEKKDENSA